VFPVSPEGDASDPMPQAGQTCEHSRLQSSPVGSDLQLLTWAENGSPRSPEAAADEAYTALAEAVRERSAVAFQERVFGDLAAAPSVLRARTRALGGSDAWAVPPTYVAGAPAARTGLAGIHVIAARGRGRLLRDHQTVYGRVLETGSARLLGLADVGRLAGPKPRHARPGDEASAAIGAAEELLALEGFGFEDVVRTWFYLRDILDWYGEFNAVRNAAFRRLGLIGPGGDGRIPASTGIAGSNLRGSACALDLVAVRPLREGGLDLRRLYNRRQNEAAEYGSAFARGMALGLGDARYVFVSGTAAIDDHGASVHVGDFEAQLRHTLDAVDTLLGEAGARLSDLAQATAFLKRPGDLRTLERVAARSGLAHVPLVTTVADVCRPELLFELDATAVVPRSGAGS
jgi:enamine deaminase RidA (YjgF/YER057c/UK114 family)